MNISNKVLELRKANAMSQEELAEKLQVSRQAVSRWENGTALPDAGNIISICKLFDVSADYLLNDEYESEEDIPAVRRNSNRIEAEYSRKLKLAGLVLAVLGVAGLIAIGVWCYLNPVAVIDVDTDVASPDFLSTLTEYNLGWPFGVLIAMVVAGILLVLSTIIISRWKKKQ